MAVVCVSPSGASAQDVVQIDQIVVEGEADSSSAARNSTEPGGENEQSGFVAKRSFGASKTNTPLIETPQSVSVVTSDQIRTQNAQTIRAATRYSAGIIPETTGGGDTRCGGFNIRGFDATANGNFLDGLRLPSTSVINFFCLDPYGAERVEVLKGPSSVLYGQNGPGGIVNYVAKKPTSQPLREVEVLGGSFDHIEGRFDFSGPIKDGPLSFRLTGVARDSGSQVDFVDDDRFFIAPVLSFDSSEDTNFTLSANYQRDRAGWGLQFFPASGTVFANNGRRIPVNRFIGERDLDYYDTDMGSVGYEFSHKINEVFTARQNVRYAFIDHKEASFYGFGYLDEAAGILQRYGSAGESTLDTFAVDNQVQADFVTGMLSHTVVAGLDYRWTKYDDAYDNYETAPIDGNSPINVFDPVYGTPVNSGPGYAQEVRQTQAGLYLQDQIKIGKLSFVLAGRKDWAETDLISGDAQESYSAFTGRVGLIYNFENGIAPYISYSESFLPPLDISATGELFQPEEGRQYEAGVKYEPVGWNSSFTASVFELTRDNVIRFDAVGGSFAPFQTGQITSRGLELEAAISLTDGLNARLAYTYLDVEITEDPDNGFEGNRPVTVPQHTASAWLDYTIRNGSLFDGVGVGAGVRYIGSSFGDDANSFKVPSATIVDALISYERDNYRLSVNATNVFDREYVASCGAANSFCFYGEGRRVTAKASVRF